MLLYCGKWLLIYRTSWFACLTADTLVHHSDYWLQLAVSIFSLLVVGRLLEPFWGSREFFKFIVFVNFFASANTFVLAIFLYIITRRESYLWVIYIACWSLVCLIPAVLLVLLTKTCEDFFNLQMVNDLLIGYRSLCQYLLAKYLMIRSSWALHRRGRREWFLEGDACIH